MDRFEFGKYATMGIGVARTMQKIELFEKVCKLCANEPKSAHQMAEELIKSRYRYTTTMFGEPPNETETIKSLTHIIAGMICSDQTNIKKFFEFTRTPEKAILVTDPYDGSTYAVKTSTRLYKFIG